MIGVVSIRSKPCPHRRGTEPGDYRTLTVAEMRKKVATYMRNGCDISSTPSAAKLDARTEEPHYGWALGLIRPGLSD